LWSEKAEKIKFDSPYGHFPSYKLRSLIIKGGDDLRQETLAMQLIFRISKIFKDSGLNLYVRPYEIIVTSANSGILGLLTKKI
jgi:phosphatidylinositol 4-kinase B